MRLGVFGGTFDPIHNGHLAVAESAADELGLERVLFVPAGQPYLKDEQTVSPAHHRMAMVELAVRPFSRFRVSDIEVRRPGPSYTADTLEELDGCLVGDREIFLIMGFDSVMDMVRWKEPSKIFERAKVAAYPRSGADKLKMGPLEIVAPGASGRIVVIQGPRLDVSGTGLRHRISEGLPVDGQLPEEVVSYIQKHGLYR